MKKNKVRVRNPEVVLASKIMQQKKRAEKTPEKFDITDMEGEEWRWVVGLEGRYKVSSMGRMRLVTSVLKIEKPLSVKIDNGYCRQTLTTKNGRKIIRVHRLVAEAFIPNPQNKETVNHINGIKSDNRVSNLEWANRSEQIVHAINNGLRPKATRAKIDIEMARKIKDRILLGGTHREIGTEFGVSRDIVGSIKIGKRWNWV